LSYSGAIVPGDGSVQAYLADNALQAAAKNAITPAGYTSAFVNTLGAAQLPGSYITYFPLNATYVSPAAPHPQLQATY
jgi:hypothetical protein